MKKDNKTHTNKKAKIVKPEKWKYLSALFIIVILVIIAYAPSIQNGFVWDDDAYIVTNKSIQSFNLKNIFSQFTMGNYHPITMVAHVIEYKFFGLKESGYHFINLLVHIFNTILVFIAVNLLSKKIPVALIASLLFGIHPLHVESVAWISELKDLLYTCFFLCSYIYYLKYLNNNLKKYYYLSLLLFLFSLLSKAMAASLPVLLILTDYFKERKLNTKSLLEKIPFFTLSIILGIVAVVAQKETGATDMTVFPFMQRIVFACYGFIEYIVKLLLPVQLCAYYAYPIRPGEDIPPQYYLYLLLIPALVVCAIYSLRASRKILLGLGFFLITIFLVLQLFPVGAVFMAERYSYVPSIGIFYLIGEGFYWLWYKSKSASSYKFPAVIVIVIAIIFFTFQTNARCGVWKNGMSLWSDVINQFQNVPTAYNNRGIIFANENKTDAALNDYNKAIELKSDYADPYNNKGVLLSGKNNNEDALKNFNKAIELNPRYADAYNNRGSLFLIVKNSEAAMKDFNMAISLRPDYENAYYNRGVLWSDKNNTDSALYDYNKAIELKPDMAEVYNSRGMLLMSLKKYDEAKNDFTMAIKYKRNFADAYCNRGVLHINENNYDAALSDLNKAIEIQPNLAKAYYDRGNLMATLKKYPEAIDDFNIAIKLQPNLAEAYYNRGLLEYNSGKKDLACTDLRQAGNLGYQLAMTTFNTYCR